MKALTNVTSTERAIGSLMANTNDERLATMGLVTFFIIPLIHEFMSGLRDQMFEHSYSLNIKIGDASIDLIKSGETA